MTNGQTGSNAKGHRPAILCFGDSNTHGACAMRRFDERRRFSSSHRWPTVMAAALDRKVRLVEAGLPGRTTVHDDPIEGAHKNGLRMLPAELESHRPLDLVILMLGTNDLKTRFSVTPTDIARSLNRLVDVITMSGAGREGGSPAVMIVAPAPITETGHLGPMFVGGAAKSEALAGLYADLAADRGIGFLNAADHAEVDPVDGVHLTQDSHHRLAEAIAGELRGVLV